jgi:hypothetical protein
MLMKKDQTQEIDEPVKQQEPKKYEKPQIKSLTQRDLLGAVKKGSKFPSRGFAG